MDTQIYIDVTRGPTRRLIVDGDLRLFRQLLEALDSPQADTHKSGTAVTEPPTSTTQPQGVQHDHP